MDYDEILNEKVDTHLGERNLTLPSLDLDRKKKRQIMNIVLAYADRGGISHQTLTNVIRINRKTLRHHMKELMEKGLITRASGKHGKYHPTTKANRGIYITANIFSESFLSRILANEDFVIQSPYFKKKNADDHSFELDDALFNFSIKVGSFITYILLQSMNPANNITDDTKNERERDLDVLKWVDDVISLIQQYLLPHFRDYIFPFLKSYNKGFLKSGGFNNLPKSDMTFFKAYAKRPLYILDDLVISELNDAFSKSYPNLSHQLEKTRLELPSLLQNEMERIAYNTYKHSTQQVCKHNYKPPANNPYNRSGIVLHCNKCHGTVRKDDR